MREGREILGLKKEEREYQILLFKFKIVLQYNSKGRIVL